MKKKLLLPIIILLIAAALFIILMLRRSVKNRDEAVPSPTPSVIASLTVEPEATNTPTVTNVPTSTFFPTYVPTNSPSSVPTEVPSMPDEPFEMPVLIYAAGTDLEWMIEDEPDDPPYTPVPKQAGATPTASPKPSVSPTPYAYTTPYAGTTPYVTSTPSAGTSNSEGTNPYAGATPSSSPTSSPATPTPVVDLSALKPGDHFRFGSYEQDNDLTNGMEPIEWIVLSNEDNELFVLSKYVLDIKKYNEESGDITWADCTLRKWLNEEFLNTAFNKDEKARILTKDLKNYDNPEYGIEGGKDTKDKVFLLSFNDMINPKYGFFTDHNASDIRRRCSYTEYAGALGASIIAKSETSEGKPSCIWWLRSPGIVGQYVMYVMQDGHVSYDGYYGSYESSVAMRPALCISLNNLSTPTPTPTPTFTPSPTPTPKPTSSPTPKYTATPTPTHGPAYLFDLDVSKLVTGDTFYLGTFEQDCNAKNGKEPIEWVVLSNKNNELFVMSRYGLESMPFNKTSSNTTWADSTIRKWLNGDFYNSSFSKDEKKLLKTKTIRNHSNTSSIVHVKNEPDTKDKVFLLSVDEAEERSYGFSGSSEFRDTHICEPTAYAKTHIKTGMQYWWWTRNTHLKIAGSSLALKVRDDYPGSSPDVARIYYENDYIVRPAMYIDLSTLNKSAATDAPSQTQIQKTLAGLKNGDVFTFGTYEQDNNIRNGEEDIEWIVLSNNNSELFVISKYILEQSKYDSANNSGNNVTWADCTLRRWLNEDFLDKAFCETEKNLIKAKTIKNADNPLTGTAGGKNTTDKIFLLSYDEVTNKAYGFNSDNTTRDINRLSSRTVYSYYSIQSTDTELTAEGRYASGWWLRSPGKNDAKSYAMYVTGYGNVDTDGAPVASNKNGIRPAMYIKLK